MELAKNILRQNEVLRAKIHGPEIYRDTASWEKVVAADTVLKATYHADPKPKTTDDQPHTTDAGRTGDAASKETETPV